MLRSLHNANEENAGQKYTISREQTVCASRAQPPGLVVFGSGSLVSPLSLCSLTIQRTNPDPSASPSWLGFSKSWVIQPDRAKDSRHPHWLLQSHGRKAHPGGCSPFWQTLAFCKGSRHRGRSSAGPPSVGRRRLNGDAMELISAVFVAASCIFRGRLAPFLKAEPLSTCQQHSLEWLALSPLDTFSGLAHPSSPICAAVPSPI